MISNPSRELNDTRFPTVLARQALDDGGVELTLFIPAYLDVFKGHFPGYSILPGVTQIDWAAHYGRAELEQPGGFEGMENLKFMRPIGADCTVKLLLTPLTKRGGIAFLYHNEAGNFSSGKLLFGG